MMLNSGTRLPNPKLTTKKPYSLASYMNMKNQIWDLLLVLLQIVTAMLVTFLINALYENTSYQCLTMQMQAKLQSE